MGISRERFALGSYHYMRYPLEYFLDTAVELESPLVLVTAGCGYFNRPAAEAWERAADSLERLAGYGLEHGVKLVLETLTPHVLQCTEHTGTAKRHAFSPAGGERLGHGGHRADGLHGS